jgi:hypothetical protein
VFTLNDDELASLDPETRTMRTLRTAFLALSLSLLTAPSLAFAQVTDLSNVGANDEARSRTKEIRDVRQTIDDYPDTSFHNAAYLLLELTPNEDGSATLTIEDKDRLKLTGVKKSEPQSATSWLVTDPDRLKLEVNYYQIIQAVACSIPKKLRGKPLSLGIFKVYESQVECFVRAAVTSPLP